MPTLFSPASPNPYHDNSNLNKSISNLNKSSNNLNKSISNLNRSSTNLSRPRRRITSWKTYVYGGLFVALLMNFLHCNVLSGMQEASELNSLLLELQPNGVHSSRRARKQPSSDDIRDVVFVPIEAYNTCDRQISHLSCLRTVIIENDHSAVEEISARIQPSLHGTLCREHLLVTSTKDETGYVEEAHVPLCLQHSATAQVFAVVAVTDTKLQRLLLPSEASLFSTPGLFVSSSGSLRVVDRKSILMPARYLPQSPKATESRMAYSYHENVGNWVWMYGSTRMVNPFTTLFYSNIAKESQHVSALVLATANALHLDKYDSYREPLIDLQKSINIGLPTIMLGIGLQKEFKETEDIQRLSRSIKLFDFQADLLRTIAQGQSQPGITVRGDLTEAACRNSGIDNCIAMGCPSLTISTNPNLGAVLQEKWEHLIKDLSSSGTASKRKLKIYYAPPAGLDILDPKDIIPTSRRILDIFRDLNKVHDTTLVQQGRKENEAKMLTEEYGFELTRFTHIEDWRKAMSEADLVISARIHGGMIALASTTPTIVIPTDYRIWELADIMHLPTLALGDLPDEKETTLLSVLSKVKVDFKAFEANRRKRLGQYEEILEEIGLEMNPELSKIVHYPAKE